MLRCIMYEWGPTTISLFLTQNFETLELMRFLKISTQIKNILGNLFSLT